MARRKLEDPPKGLAPWLATFGDLMNLLLCFFVLLFSMSNIDAQKYAEVAASFASSFSIFQSGGTGIGEGVLVSSGTTQLNLLDEYFSTMGRSEEGEETDDKEEFKKAQLAESEKMSEDITKAVESSGIADKVRIDFTTQYVRLTLNGALLFDSGKAEVREESLHIVDRVGNILLQYADHVIEIEGHTDNVPISSPLYKNNNVLSTFRALSVSEYLINEKGLSPEKLKYSGRGEYVPVADNATADGRARNRRVEIKIYNTLSE
ncbi:OmpA/MotB family protein [Anaerobium acetethylicum]|uniref:Chemotaxis protein MotB n=1 Tax=Anaerobium acetethylicum TaxID=1619234 RepID=A0A1D3TQS9_9FIRM|nr:flagellar motor protein MotB [Anaerobium acetethylicum]SCP95925.1 chemotaxis protein MotB [Anaerobium acetethylicum]